MRDLRADLGRVFGAPIMDRGVWGVDVRSLDTGERLYALNAGKLMMPASNMKIVTLAAAAEALGLGLPLHDDARDRRRRSPDGVLHGDLIVRGSGDPTINTRERPRRRRVRRVGRGAPGGRHHRRSTGASSATTRRSTTRGSATGWAWDYLQYGYAAPVGALEFNENVATLTIAPGRDAGRRRPFVRADARHRPRAASTAR